MDSLNRYLKRITCLIVSFATLSSSAAWAQGDRLAAEKITAIGGIVNVDTQGNIEHIAFRLLKPTSMKDIEFGQLKHVNSVMLFGGHVSDEVLVKLQELPSSVKFLTFSLVDGRFSEDALIGLLKKQSALKYLMINAAPIADRTLVAISKLEHLEVLYLDGTKITDNGLKSLSKMRLTNLSMRNTQVSDIGMQELKKMTDLRQLFLEGTKVTDQGLLVLEDLRGLSLLGINSTNVTEGGKIALKTVLPDLRFYEFKKR